MIFGLSSGYDILILKQVSIAAFMYFLSLGSIQGQIILVSANSYKSTEEFLLVGPKSVDLPHTEIAEFYTNKYQRCLDSLSIRNVNLDASYAKIKSKRVQIGNRAVDNRSEYQYNSSLISIYSELILDWQQYDQDLKRIESSFQKKGISDCFVLIYDGNELEREHFYVEEYQEGQEIDFNVYSLGSYQTFKRRFNKLDDGNSMASNTETYRLSIHTLESDNITWDNINKGTDFYMDKINGKRYSLSEVPLDRSGLVLCTLEKNVHERALLKYHEFTLDIENEEVFRPAVISLKKGGIGFFNNDGIPLIPGEIMIFSCDR